MFKKNKKQFQIIAAGGPVFWDLKKNDPHREKKKTHKLSWSGSLGNPDILKGRHLWEMKLLGRKNSC